jgi:hypothetical protein
MPHSDASSRLSSVPSIKPPPLNPTHSLVQAHRFTTPKSTRATTEPGGIDAAIISIITSRSPNSHRIHKLLRIKATPQRNSVSKAHAEVFERAYSKERRRVMTEMEDAEEKRRRLRAKLGLTRKPTECFYKFERADLRYIEGKLPLQSPQGRFQQRLHPICRLYE